MCAKKEVLEETGHKVETLKKLSILYPDSGRLGNKVHMFFATSKHKLTKKVDKKEEIKVLYFTKNQIIEGFAMHHNLYTKIKMPQNFVDTTFYDENNNNQVWSHLWGLWEATSKKSGKSTSNPVNVSFKWVDGRVVSASWIFDPTELNEEIIASQK